MPGVGAVASALATSTLASATFSSGIGSGAFTTGGGGMTGCGLAGRPAAERRPSAGRRRGGGATWTYCTCSGCRRCRDAAATAAAGRAGPPAPCARSITIPVCDAKSASRSAAMIRMCSSSETTADDPRRSSRFAGRPVAGKTAVRRPALKRACCSARLIRCISRAFAPRCAW